MSEELTWSLSREGETCVVSISGVISEEADFAPLAQELASAPSIRFHLGGVIRINSCGTRGWIRFMRLLPEQSKLEMSHCNPSIVAQLNMINNFAGRAVVSSVYAPFVCTDCDQRVDLNLDVTSGEIPPLTGLKCEGCGGELEFDDLVRAYFGFLQDAARPGGAPSK